LVLVEVGQDPQWTGNTQTQPGTSKCLKLEQIYSNKEYPSQQLAHKNRNSSVPPPPIPPKIKLEKDTPPPLPPKLQLFINKEQQEEASNASLLADSFYGSSKV